MKNINVIHLASGEQIVAEVKSQDSTTLCVRNAAILVPAGQGKIGLAPYAPYTSSADLCINYANVTWSSEAHEELANEYNTAFGNGLVSVPAGAANAIPNLKITD